MEEFFKLWNDPSNLPPNPPQPAWSPAYSESYSPDLCAVCCGAKYVSDDGHLKPCPLCNPEPSADLMQRRRLDDMLEECRRSLHVRNKIVSNNDFETFETLDDDHERMLKAASAYVAEPLGWLTFHGMGLGRRGSPDRLLGSGEWRTGSGKTHLVQAIARALIAQGTPAYYCRAPELYRWLGAVERTDTDPDYAARREWIHRVPVLIIDDHNQEHQSNFVWQTRSEIFVSRYAASKRGDGGSLVIVSNDAPQYWEDPSSCSRAYDAGPVVLASAYDYRINRRGGRDGF